ncbi:VOC family protein [Mycobacterium sp. SMC-2]|uniref:VOC family protein n=1 Tax=Mycobacterium TaxID=1763 RepID=UPI001CE0DB8A|nr:MULTISPECIES: VOC family protein [Mycobacterium]MCA4759014.1 VOC family protein [Mycobacterium avium subsp. hominissuis]UXA06401.1 VOC family protein [Mycobacterium sp. SMC-2]
MPTSDDLARRFLHVNLNSASLDVTEALYAQQLGLSARMRTDPEAPTDGRILGLDGESYCATSFLYDARGGRRGCALEVIEWHSPTLKRDPRTDPLRPGIRSALMTVSDLAGTVTTLRERGVPVGDPVAGLISGSKSALVLDPDGVVIELAEAIGDPAPSAGALFSGIRIAAIDAGKTAEFLTSIGFAVVEAPNGRTITGDQLAPGGPSEPVECVLARFVLPEDDQQFSLTVVEHPGSADQPPVPWGGNHQGLYRCALRVENVEKALAALPDSIEPQGNPVWCPLPGTKIGGLYIAFLRSPDGVVFEFVERPLKYFQR